MISLIRTKPNQKYPYYRSHLSRKKSSLITRLIYVNKDDLETKYTNLKQEYSAKNSLEKKLNIPNDSIVQYPYGYLTSLDNFCSIVNIPLIIGKYRYYYNWSAQFLFNDELDERYCEHNRKRYTVEEMSIIIGIPYDIISNHIRRMCMMYPFCSLSRNIFVFV